MSEEEKTRHDEEYQSMLALYISMLNSKDKEQIKEALYRLAEMRMDVAFGYVVEGLGVDIENALSYLKNLDDNNVTEYDKELRKRIDAATQNLIDFSVCEEYQLYEEAVELSGEELDFDEDDYESLLWLCEKYNDRYAAVENSDIRYSGIVAAMWMRMSEMDYVVYWTQNDAHVRPTHMLLHGYTAPRIDFPSWLIPPIEYNCRCYLEVIEVPMAKVDIKQIKGSAPKIEKPTNISDVYKESLATCGRIFSDAHSYFSIKEQDREMLKEFVERLKEKYYGTSIH